MTDDLPFLDLTAPGFSTRGPEVRTARAAAWCARTPFGLAVLRHAQAGRLLRDRRLRQGSHAWPDRLGLGGSFAAFWKRSVISREGAAHKAQRALALAALAPDHIAGLAPAFAAAADDILDALPADGRCEFIGDVSEPFAGRAITILLGLPATEARAVARDAAALGLAMGLDGKRHEPIFDAACERLAALAATLLARARAAPGRNDYAARLLRAAEACAEPVAEQVLRDLIVISIFGGVDTTRAQLGFAMALLADHPDQWQALRADPALVPNAIEEAIRARPTTTWATREALEDFTVDGVPIARGETLHILVHATGTDPAAVPGWRFDLHARRKAHFGFGGGAHHCLGQLVARTDMAAALGRIVARFEAVEWDGRPDYLPDSGNTSPRTLPLRLVAAPG